MRSNVLRKPEYTRQDYTRDYFKAGEEPWEVRRARIAQMVEAAINLPGNMSDPDFEEFISQYGTKTGSDFA